MNLSTYDLQPNFGPSVIGRGAIEIRRANEFAVLMEKGENPHKLGAWEALTNSSKCGGLKSRRAISIAQKALRKAGWVFVVRLSDYDYDSDGEKFTIPSSWGLVPASQANEWDASGVSLSAALEKIGGWQRFYQ